MRTPPTLAHRKVSPRRPPFYNVPMAAHTFETMKHHVGFQDRDVENVLALAPVVEPVLEEVVDAFYHRILMLPDARAVFSEGQEQIRRVHAKFSEWLAELFRGRYDDAYYQKRLEIGRAHVRVNMPQHFMFTSIEVIWQEMRHVVLRQEVPDVDEKLESLHKLLMLELAVMLESYKESYASLIRQEERTVAEERLTRSEHLAEIGQLAASLAHEMKNPLAGISGAIQVIRDHLDEKDPLRDIIREILEQINRLDRSVKDLLTYARPNPPELRPCRVDAIISRTIRLMRDTPAFRRVDVRFEHDEHLPAVPADERQIEQLILNLLVNAAHASKDRAIIDTRLTMDNGMLKLTVRDQGVGMDQAVAARAFEPFFTTKAKGTGLGLSICRKIVDAHKGTITLQSEAGKGTEVVVELSALRPVNMKE